MEFKWLNESTIKKTADRIEIKAPGQTDFFCGSIDECEEGILPESRCNAPYYYTEVEGDFVLKVKVSHDFKDTYDSASVMVMKDNTCWAKCCFERKTRNIENHEKRRNSRKTIRVQRIGMYLLEMFPRL